MDPREFFSANRFLFDAVMASHREKKKNMDSVAGLLRMKTHSLRNQLLDNHMPQGFNRLYDSALAVADVLSPPPPCYITYSQLPDDGTLDQRSIELLSPVAPYHFDHIQLLQARFSCPISTAIHRLFATAPGTPSPPPLPKLFQFNPKLAWFRDRITASVNRIPRLIRNVGPDHSSNLTMIFPSFIFTGRSSRSVQASIPLTCMAPSLCPCAGPGQVISPSILMLLIPLLTSKSFSASSSGSNAITHTITINTPCRRHRILFA